MNYPEWILREIRIKKKNFYTQLDSIETNLDLKKYAINTICYESKCPNKGKCFKEKHATFLILGTICTRNCKFCSVSKSIPLPPNPQEPQNISILVKKWGLKYVVFTSPTRDDIIDGGATQFKKTIIEIKKLSPDTITEPLIPDFNGNIDSINTVISANPEVISHNIEMIKRLYSTIRPKSNYNKTLNIIKTIKKIAPQILTKSSIIIGLGENTNEIKKTIDDLKENLCDIIVIGQYLNPSKKHIPIKKFYTQKEFKEIENYANKIGFKAVISTPLARTSYMAYHTYKTAIGKK